MERPMSALDRPARGLFGTRWGHRAGLLCLGVLMISSCLGAEAFGNFGPSAPAAPTMSLAAATLAAPTGLSASGGCALLIIGPQVSLDWNQTSSAFATGYQVLR